MKIVCLDADTLGDADLSVFSRFGEFVKYKTTTKFQTIERLQGVDVVITNKVLIDKEVMDSSNLKLICISATGMNNVDIQYAKVKNISVKNVAGYSTNSVAQHSFACILNLLNNINFYDNYTKSGLWAKSEIFTNLDKNIYEINGKNFGIIGFGAIGQKVAQIASVFGANVCYYSTSGNNLNQNFKSVSLNELLKNSDIVSVHAPLNEKTKGLIGSNELNLMKDNSVICNVGRGGIIDENALAKAIDDKNIKACIDVLENEPMMENHPLLNVKNKSNLIITPHIAWASVEARNKLMDLIIKNIEDYLNGK